MKRKRTNGGAAETKPRVARARVSFLSARALMSGDNRLGKRRGIMSEVGVWRMDFSVGRKREGDAVSSRRRPPHCDSWFGAKSICKRRESRLPAPTIAGLRVKRDVPL